MSKYEKILQRILKESEACNIRFNELCSVLKRLGFSRRTRGSHFIYYKDGIDDIINIQSNNGMAKNYQVKQIRKILIKYELGVFDE